MRGPRVLRGAAPAPVPAGETLLPGYRVVAPLARGRRLETYDAWDEERGCRVVVKILREDRRDEQQMVDAMLREGAILTTLDHPHLVRGYEVSTDPPAVVLETLPGATLDALVEDGPLSAQDTAHLGLQLASAVGYLHRHGWLHLDIKAANVVVTESRAVLIDLSHTNRPGDCFPGAGTAGYLAPEQVTGRNLGPATDVWLLGTTLWEALTAALPHDPGPGSGLLPRRRRHTRVEPRALPGDVPTPLAEVLVASLSPTADDRPTLTALAAACAEVTGDPRSPEAS